MTTNLEWLYENDRETLITMTSGDCSECKFDSDCAKAFCRCDRSWLEAEYEEYVEPDSWEKIERDAIDVLINKCPASTANAVYELICRCKKLAGVE